MKKLLAFTLVFVLIFSFAACGGNAPAAQNEGTSQSSDGGRESVETSEQESESDLSFPVPTEEDPPAVCHGINMVNLVPEDCTAVVYDEGVYIFKMPSQPTGEMLVNFINEKLIPELEACSDTGVCLVKDNNSGVDLGLDFGWVPYRAFDSFGYRTSDNIEYAYWIIDGEQYNERQLLEDLMLLNIMYVYDGVLYNAITSVKEQAISVTPFEEPNQKYEIVE